MILILRKQTKLEKEINEIEKEMKTALPFTKQYLEGKLSILKQIQTGEIRL